MCTGIQEPGRGRVVLVSCMTYSINAASNDSWSNNNNMHDSHNPIIGRSEDRRNVLGKTRRGGFRRI